MGNAPLESRKFHSEPKPFTFSSSIDRFDANGTQPYFFCAFASHKTRGVQVKHTSWGVIIPTRMCEFEQSTRRA